MSYKSPVTGQSYEQVEAEQELNRLRESYKDTVVLRQGLRKLISQIENNELSKEGQLDALDSLLYPPTL